MVDNVSEQSILERVNKDQNYDCSILIEKGLNCIINILILYIF